MRALLRLLREHEAAVEADLSRYHGIDYRDRWRYDEHGRRRLTLRMILVRTRAFPPDSAVGRALGIELGWKVGDYLLADVYHALTGKRHPARPRGTRSRVKAPTPDRAKKVAAARRRARARAARIARGDL